MSKQAADHVLLLHTFAIDFEVNNDWLHGALTVPPQALSCPPAHFPHEELTHASRHWRCPEELILTATQTQWDRERERFFSPNTIIFVIV